MPGHGPPKRFRDVPDDPSLADPLPRSPLPLLERWIREAHEGRVQRNPGALVLATLDSNGALSARVVLCRGYDAERGFVVFFSNRNSRKGRALDENPRAAAVFHWDALQRQVRIEGRVGISPAAETDAYFSSRARPVQIAAWASQQSEPIASREAFLTRLAAEEQRFDAQGSGAVPRPPHWTGYRLSFERVECWVGAEGRAHDRALWTRELSEDTHGMAGGDWKVARLQP